ncbi:tripartite tricarboxylate transporter substrate binding protein [Bordetella sp. BOR01]|uniref:Bug family tripartite tricarboxylate transporter substrate binding protein n=1 Tax=Bordetella sp. BOR01 TaxID=2854779 RepID=UPI001C456479|nr:tripartite tricarboxylate transporter substrate-binding protein [Bordetella sp. BOR01]MBV7484821.1 tripartite tricarboxylate transporter substrate binding protein [Bordetella sp. BOR01]
MKKIARLILAGILTHAMLPVHAQSTYPDRPVTLVVGFTAGGANDKVAREIGHRLSKLWNQSVVVENRSGASGAIAAVSVASAKPNGLRLLVGPVTLTMLPAVQEGLPFDMSKDFTPVGLIAKSPLALTVSNDLEVDTLDAFLALAATKDLFAGTTGPGAVDHFGSLLLMEKTGVHLQDIAYRGGPELLTDLMANRVNMSMSSAATIAPHANGGKLKVLAVTGTERSPVLSAVPTFLESGVTGVDISQWWGLFAPAATPRAIIEKINDGLNTVLNEADLQQALLADGAIATPMTTAAFGTFVSSELSNWKGVAGRTGIKAK